MALSSPAGGTSVVEIKVVRAHGLPKLGIFKCNDRFYVKLSSGHQEYTTKTIKRRSPVWNETFELTLVGQMPELSLDMYGMTSSKQKGRLIGHINILQEDDILHTDGSVALGQAKSHTYTLSMAGHGGILKARCTLAIETKIVSQGTSGETAHSESEKSDGSPPIATENPMASPHSETPAEPLEPITRIETYTASIHPSSDYAQKSDTSGGHSAAQTVGALVEGIARPGPNESNSTVNEKMAAPALMHVGITVGEHSITCGPHTDDVEARSTMEATDQTIQRASDAVHHMKNPKIPNTPEGMGETVDAVERVGSIVISLLDKMEGFAKLMDHVSEIHPYASAAWKLISAVPKLLKDQIEQDEQICDLCGQMNKLYDRIHRLVDPAGQDGIGDIEKRQKEILSRVARQANNCAYFIVDYCKRSFAKRTVAHMYSGEPGRKLQEYKSAFERLEKELDEEVEEETHMIATLAFKDVAAMGKAVENLNVESSINKLSIVPGASLIVSDTSPKQCLRGTRVDLLDEITDWINGIREDSEKQRILLLHGMAGTGKSSIAHTIASRFHALSRLGASFAFSRSTNSRSVNQLFPHIARLLINLDPTLGLKHRLAAILDESGEILSSPDPKLHFEAFIMRPLREVTITGPIVIVIDAVDEAPEGANNLTSLLAECCVKLPSNVRILVTSRPEGSVLRNMDTPAVLRLPMPDSTETTSDVSIFIRAQLLHLPLKDITEECCDTLTKTSQGLFQWAATACKEITGEQMGSTPHKRYEMVVESGRGRDRLGLLDSLYRDVLRRACDPDTNPGGHQLLKQVITVLFALMEPMTLDNLAQLYNQLEFGEESDVGTTLPYLASLLDGISDRTRPVQPNHTSLRDFFLDSDRSGPFCVKDLLPATHGHIARHSFSIVSTFLPQNAYGLDFARLHEDEYLELEADRVHREISSYLVYAILYCVKHLAEAPAPEEAFWIGMGSSFLADNCAPPWIEVFCLLATHRLNNVYLSTPPKLSDCMGLLARITKRQGSTCPDRVQSVVELISTIVETDGYISFLPVVILKRLGLIYRSVGWTVKLRHQPKDGPSITIGSGFFLKLHHASHNVILTTAHNLVDANGQPHTDLVVDVPQQVPHFDGASQFTDIQHPVPPIDIRFCADFLHRPQLETDWGAIFLPQGTALSGGCEFDTQSGVPIVMGLGTYGRSSWIPHHPRRQGNDSTSSADITPIDRIALTGLGNLVTSGAPSYALFSSSVDLFRLMGPDQAQVGVRGICNPIYGDEAYTRLTPALVGELGSWVGISRSNMRLRWLPPAMPKSDSEEAEGVSNIESSEHPRAVPDWRNLYLFVNEEEGSRLYLKRGSGSYFDVYLSNSYTCSLGFGSKPVEVQDGSKCNEDAAADTYLMCGPASGSGSGLRLEVDTVEDPEKISARVYNAAVFSSYFSFRVEPTPITSPDHDELFKISLQRRRFGIKQGQNDIFNLDFILE